MTYGFYHVLARVSMSFRGQDMSVYIVVGQ